MTNWGQSDSYRFSIHDCYDQLDFLCDMKSNRWLALLALFVMVGCHHQNTLEGQIQAFITTQCHGVWPCSISLQRATPFGWDRLFVFKYNASKADIENAVHTALPKYQELTRYLVFQKAGMVVRIESEPTDVEHPIKDEIVFEMPDAAVYQSFTASTEFNVTQENSEAGSYFLLKAK